MTRLREDTLDAETKGRVQGKLLVSDEYLMAFGDEIDAAREKGLLPQIDVPPMLPIPVRVPLVSAFSLAGSGVIEGLRWETVKSWLTTPADRFIPIAVAAREALGAVAASAFDDTRERAEWLAARLRDPSGFLDDVRRRLRGLLEGSELAPAGMALGLGPLGFGGLGPETIEILQADASGELTGGPIHLDPNVGDVEQRPVVTPEGVFRLVVSSDNPALAGRQLVAVLRLIEGEAIRFDAKLVPVSGGGRQRAEFHAEGLPALGRDVNIPWASVLLVAIPAEPARAS